MARQTIAIALLARLVGAGAGFGLAQSTKTTSGTNMSSAMDGMAEGLAGLSGPDFERAFIAEMIVHHEGALAMARMVPSKTNRPKLVQLANAIITAQTSEIDLKRGWESAWLGLATSTAPHPAH